MKNLLFVTGLLFSFSAHAQVLIMDTVNHPGDLPNQTIVTRAIFDVMSKAVTIAAGFTQTATKTVSATTTETSLTSTGVGSLTIPANAMAAGKMYRITIRGVYNSPLVTAAGLVVKIKIGSVVVATATITALAVNAVNQDFEGTTLVTCRSAGTSGSVMTTGDLQYSTLANAAFLHVPLNNGQTATTVNTTAANTVDATVTYSSNAAGNSISALNVSLEALN